MAKPSIKIIEPILKRDFEAALELVRKNLFSGDFFTIRELERASSGELLIAKIDGKVVGMIRSWYPGTVFREHDDEYFFFDKLIYPKEKLGYISLISVDMNYQGQGIGRKLVAKVIEQQKQWGAKAIIVHASKNSPGDASCKLFSSFGFISVGIHKSPWLEYSQELGPNKFQCVFCGNPCVCDELEMVLDLGINS